MRPGTAHRTARVVSTLAVGGLLAIPAGWLMATLALLPLFLGLFFNMIVGLLIGAVVFRIARPAAPFAMRGAIALGAWIAVSAWTAGLAFEYLNTRGYDLPWYREGAWQWVSVDGDATRTARLFFRHRSMTAPEKTSLRVQTREAFDHQLAERYPPGGFAGFLRWSAARQGELEVPTVFSAASLELNPKQRGVPWLIRSTLSLLLLCFAVLSQVLGLAKQGARTDPGDCSASIEDSQQYPPGDAR